MRYIDAYNLWKQDEFFDKTTRDKLALLDIDKDSKEIEECFYRELEFGTGGLRGIMGIGTNRMNQYTVGKATTGLGKYLLDTYGERKCCERGVVIGYDTRNNSEFFARITANILSGMGIHVFLERYARPTPQLSFAVKFINALAGIVVTASHNPKEYNGYKVYDEFGCQLVPWQVEKVIAYINDIEDYRTINFSGNDGLIDVVDTTDDFVTAVMSQKRYRDNNAKKNLKIVYTPLHGTGNVPVREVLERDGFCDLNIVEEQATSDGNFPTVASPNPEERSALKIGIEYAMEIDADIVLGTDPDSDRVGVAVKTSSAYQLLTGNQIGALLMDFLLNNTDFTIYKNPAIVKTIVTSELGAAIAQKKGLKVFSTLTGFKYIGEKITQFQQAKEKKEFSRDYDFIFGYEESYGYLVGTHAQDKDAVVSSMLISEMAAWLKTQGKNLVERINEIYEEFGFYLDAMDNFTLKGKEGLEKINYMMECLRKSNSLFQNTKQVIDYKKSVEAEEGFGVLPTSNVLKYVLQDDSWIAVRPSGTEPKIKIYYSIKGKSRNEAEKRLNSIQKKIKNFLNL